MNTLEQRFPKKRVLITGTTSGLGRALSVEFGRRGWRVAVTGIEEIGIRQTAKAVRRADGVLRDRFGSDLARLDLLHDPFAGDAVAGTHAVAMEKRRLYSLPQADARALWRASRWMPEKFRNLLTYMFNKRLWLFSPGNGADVGPQSVRS